VTATTWKQKRGRLARLSQDLPPGHPDLVELRRDFNFDRLGEHIQHVVSQAPPFTQEQVDQLRVLLEPARRDLADDGDNTCPSADRKSVIDARTSKFNGGATK
jgi:hypothetical protein